MGLFSRIFGDYSEREIKKITPIVDKIDSLADAYASLTDAAPLPLPCLSQIPEEETRKYYFWKSCIIFVLK